MLTLTLCESPYGYLIQTTDEHDALVDITALCGSTFSCRLAWSALAEVGEQEDVEDTDGYWYAVDNAITFLATKDPRKGWNACRQAYEGVLNARELAQHFRELRAEI